MSLTNYQAYIECLAEIKGYNVRTYGDDNSMHVISSSKAVIAAVVDQVWIRWGGSHIGH